MKTILCVLLLTGTMFASFTLYNTNSVTNNGDGTITVTPTVEVVGVDDISNYEIPFDCVMAWNAASVVVSGNPWKTQRQIPYKSWIDYSYTFPQVTGTNPNISYGGVVQAVCDTFHSAYPSNMLSGYAGLGFGQASDPENSAVVIQRIMTTAVARCFSTVNGVKKISFEAPTNQEFAEVKALGQEAVAPLAKYLDLEPKDGLRQLIAVKFLMAIGGSSTLDPLKRAFAQDQWEVTRAAALDGIFAVSQVEAKPYVEAAFGDKSQLVRRRAQHLWILYQRQTNDAQHEKGDIHDR